MKKLVILLAVLFTANMMMAQKDDLKDARSYLEKGQYEEAKISIQKCMKNPDMKDKMPEIYQCATAIISYYYDKGYAAFESQDYANAAISFKKAYDSVKSFDFFDFINNPTDILKYAAYACVMDNNYNQAIKYYNELKNDGYQGQDLYYNLASAYKNNNDKGMAAKMIAEGLAMYPQSDVLIRENVNLKLSEGRGAEAVADLEKLLEASPDDYSLMVALGNIYGDDTNGIYDADKAINYYTQAIKIKPDDYDANYNLGALYINMSNRIKAQADEITGSSKAENEQWDKLIKESNSLIERGLPYVRYAFDAQPNKEVGMVLKSMYIRLTMNDEAEALDKRLEKL